MKKLLLFTGLLCLFIVTSCSSDNNTIGRKSQELSRIYRGDNLKLTLNEKEIMNHPIKFITTDLQTAEITLDYLIPGEPNLLYSDVQLVLNQEGDYTFVIEDNTVDQEVLISGKIIQDPKDPSKNILSVDVSYKSLSSIIGKWKPKTGIIPLLSSPLEIEIIHPDEDAQINMHGVWGYEETSLDNFTGIIRLIGGMVIGNMLDLTFEFDELGNMSVAWESKNALIPIETGESGDDVLRFNTKDDNLYLAIALDSILFKKSESSAQSDILTLFTLIQEAYHGLPLKVDYVNDNNITLYVNRELMLPYIEPLINVLKPSIADVDFGDIGEMLGLTGESVSGLADEVVRLVKESDEFEIKLHLAKQRRSADEVSKQLTEKKIKELIKQYQLSNPQTK